MGRLIEFLCFLLIVYLFYRRMVSPFRRGFDARDRERREHDRLRRQSTGEFHQAPPADRTAGSRNPTNGETRKIDRSQVEDADFKDID